MLLFYKTMVAIDPNYGNEMGKKNGDQIIQTGNHSINAVRIHKGFLYVLALLSIHRRLQEPLNVLDWILFILATLGVFISYWGYLTLKDFYTFTLGTREEHKIITNGPYKYFAHPGYFGQFIIIMGSIIFYRVNTVLTIIICGLKIYSFIKRIITEENMLFEKFGKDYTTFLKIRTIPLILNNNIQ